MKFLFLACFILLYSKGVYAQEAVYEDSLREYDEDSWQNLLESESDDESATLIVDEYSALSDNPININSATVAELHRIPALTNILASRIVARRKIKKYTSLDELITLEGMTQELLSFIRPYLTVQRMGNQSLLRGTLVHRMSIETEKRKGFVTGEFLGSREKTYNKIHLHAGDENAPLSTVISEMEIGALTEKDPGEQYRYGFYSGCIGVSIPAVSTRLIIGNYKVETGEGLVFWRGAAFSKGNDISTPARKNGTGLHPFVSSNENTFFQGVAMSTEISQVSIQIFYSRKSIPASLDSLRRITSIDQSGLYRTEHDLQSKNSSHATLIGCNGSLELFDCFKFGSTIYQTNFENPYMLSTDEDRAITRLGMISLNCSYTNKTVDVFTECAIDRNRALAMIGGIVYIPLAAIKFSLVARNYPPKFLSLYGNAFGENSAQLNNERGIYIGTQYVCSDHLTFTFYYDQYIHPQSTGTIPTPSHGNDFMALTHCQLTAKYGFDVRYSRKESPLALEENDFYGRRILQVVPRLRENVRLTNKLKSSSRMSVVNRIEWCFLSFQGYRGGEHGLLVSQDIKYKVFSTLTLKARFIMYETNSYESRIYEYEDDLPYASSNKALYGRGIRWYAIVNFELFQGVHISTKYAQTIKDGLNSLGTGLDEIAGNTQSLLSIQMDIHL